MQNGERLTLYLDAAVALARQAGQVILKHYGQAQKIRAKGDHSPLTEADLAANDCLLRGLSESFPDIPVISEESPIPDYEERKNWSRFWLVDPLDGTKEFIKGTGEFTVNVALVENGEPVVGVISAPAQGLLYHAAKGGGAWKTEGPGQPVRIWSKSADFSRPLVIVESRSHGSPETDRFIRKYRPVRRMRIGSSLKFCLLAEGAADIYPRLGPTMEWDVAAGDCIYRNSGRMALRRSSLTYNKKTLRNRKFILGLGEADA